MSIQLKSRASFNAYLRRGEGVCAGQLVQVKYNHCHRADDGQFTFSNGNCSGESGDPYLPANALTRGGERRPSAGSGTAPKPIGPFQFHATRKGKSGDAARAMNKIATDPGANVNIDLGGHDLNIARTGPDTIKLSLASGALTAEGSFARVPGKQAIDILVRNHRVSKLASFAMRVTSFPTHIRIFESEKKRLAYKIDKPITATAFGKPIHRKAGIFNFDE
jgi:hypothetical protein